MYSIVMSYVHGENKVILMTDESHLEWIVGIDRAGQDKYFRCLGCEQGLDIFDQCVNNLRHQALSQENLDINIQEHEMN